MLNFIDDHSRHLVASRAFGTTKGLDVVDVFQAAAQLLGLPASVLTDNGAIFNAESRGGRGALVTLLDALGVGYKHSRPYHPQTCGKVELAVLGKSRATQYPRCTFAGGQQSNS